LRALGRRFLGQRPSAPTRESGLAAVADVLISGPGPVASSSGGGAVEPARAAASPPAEPVSPPRGLYALVPAGIEPNERRRVGLAVARRLAPTCRASAVFVFENGRADAHVFGELACGRTGPQSCLNAADVSHAVSDLVGQCDQVALVLLDPPNGLLASLGRAVRRAVFVAAPEPESLVETYREVKHWRSRGAETPLALFVVGGDGAEAAALHTRISAAAQQFLGCRLDHQGSMGQEAPAAHAEPPSLISQAPVEDVWPRLVWAVSGHVVPVPEASAVPPLAAATVDLCRPVQTVAQAAAAAAALVPARDPAPAEFPAFAWWTPENRGLLLEAVEAQVPALMGERLRLVFRVDVAEPDAPPLAAVRDDGALVAILVKEAEGPTDTQAARRWLEIHRSLVARAYPAAGVSARAPAAIVLAPLAPPASADGIRRFIPVRSGGRHGVVLLP